CSGGWRCGAGSAGSRAGHDGRTVGGALMGVLRWWRGLSQVARFDLYTRWSVYVLLAVGPITIVSAFTHPQPIRPALAVIAGASIVQAIVGVAVVRATLDRRPTGRPAPRLLY